MHLSSILIPILIAPAALAAPELRQRDPVIEERHIVELTKRQANVAQLLQLASLAGITTLPSDPALLLSLGPLASSLAAQLPTSSVLAVLVTAAPSGFLSSIVNDASYASSFASDFSAGSSPSWFNGLPTGVRSYLHTYSGFAGVAGAAQAAKTGASALESSASSSGSSGSGSMTTTSGMGSTTASGADSQSTSAPGQGVEQNTASSEGGASRPTGVIAAGVLGAVGVMGLVGL